MESKTLGQRVRELREARDLSLRELARQLGDLSAAFLSDIELGRRFPSDKVLKGMAQALGVQVEELARYDTRGAVAEIKRLASTDPAYGIAFRKLVETKMTPDQLMKLVESARKKKTP